MNQTTTSYFILMFFCLTTWVNYCRAANSSRESYFVHANERQCLVKSLDDPIRMKWSLNCSNATCDYLNIELSKMSPTFCLVIQFFSESDWTFIHVDRTRNFQVKDSGIPNNVRFRLFCYFQDMGAWDFDMEPLAFCFTGNGSSFSTNCSDGYVNNELDSMIGDSLWNFTRRYPFQQYLMKLTNLTVQIPIKLSNQTIENGLQMHVMLIDIYSYPQNFELRFIGKQYYIIPLIVNQSVEISPYWDEQCNDMTYNSRSQYYIWKMTAICVGVVQFSIVFVLLILKRKHRILESRFIIPFVSTMLYILQCLTNIFLNVFYYDPEWDTLIEELVLIIVMSLHLLQGFRYYITRLCYSKYYSRRDGLLMRILLSKIPFLIAIVLVVTFESVIVALMVAHFSYNRLPTLYDSIAIICGFSYMLLLGTGLVVHFVVNFQFAKKLKSPKKIFKWFFLHDDTFGYNGEFLVFVLIWILAGVHFGISEICSNFLTISLYDNTRPLSTLYVNNGFGYTLYGITKIILTLGFSLQYLYLVGRTYVKAEKNSFNIKQQKEEMDIFLSKIFNDGNGCIDIFKRFLIAEFKLELLEIYIFLSENPKSTLMDLIQKYPQNYFAITRYFTKSKLDSKYSVCYGEATELLVEVFSRLKQTLTYEEEYLRKIQHEMQYVLDSIK